MFSFGERLTALLIASALLFAALRVHKSSGKHSNVTKPVGVVLAFCAGAAFLVTFVGGWITTKAGAGLGVAGLIVCLAIIGVDWLADRRPDRPAFWAAFMLSLFIVAGVAGIPRATGQVGDGVQRVGNTINENTDGQPPARPAR